MRQAACLGFLLFSHSPADAQTTSAGIQHVKWPLLDLVVVPDSSGVWLLVAPTPNTTQWDSGSHLVSLGLDPISALQWATVSRKLTSGEAAVTPTLRSRRRSSFIILGKNPARRARTAEQFVLVASDSGSRVHWKAYASSSQVDTLLFALERAAGVAREVFNPAAEPEPDAPVQVVKIPKPAYPSELAFKGRVGRVWMQYVVDSTGRVRPGSFRALLADDPRFTQAAIRALLRGRFRPAISRGQAVSQRVFQVIHFRMP